MKVGEYGITIEGELVKSDGTPLNLTEATSVKLVMKLKKEITIVDCDIIDPEAGTIEYVINDELLVAAGTLKLEVVADYGENYKFKSKGVIKEKVERAVDG